jgi:DNA-binding beta-propeller fold protein YncE
MYVVSELGAASSTGAVSVFARDPSNGTLTHLHALFDGGAHDGEGLVTGLDSPTSVAVSPEGDHVYVAASNGVSTFERNCDSGRLTFLRTHVLAEEATVPTSLALGSEGQSAFVTAGGALVAFSRNVSDGVLTRLPGTYSSVEGATKVMLNLSSERVFVSGHQSIGYFQRGMGEDGLTGGGGLVFVRSTALNQAGALSIALSPDEQFALVASGGSVSVHTANCGCATGKYNSQVSY